MQVDTVLIKNARYTYSQVSVWIHSDRQQNTRSTKERWRDQHPWKYLDGLYATILLLKRIRRTSCEIKNRRSLGHALADLETWLHEWNRWLWKTAAWLWNKIAANAGISVGSVDTILHDDLKMRKSCAIVSSDRLVRGRGSTPEFRSLLMTGFKRFVWVLCGDSRSKEAVAYGINRRTIVCPYL